jgi:intracellular sulfur oxidation DsrE/DsrF family protein
MRMSAQPTFSDELLHSYIDGELDSLSGRQIRDAMKQDDALRVRVQALMRTKEMMRLAFSSAEPPRAPKVLVTPRAPRPVFGLVVSLLVLVMCFGVGVLGYRTAPILEQAFALQGAPSQPTRLVLHIGESDPEHFSATLAYTERYLRENAGSDTMVEVVANAGGLDLLRQGNSPHEARILELMDRHENLQFVACMNSLRNLRRQGVAPALIRDVRTDQTAVDHIIERVLQGWTYVKVDQLPEV